AHRGADIAVTHRLHDQRRVTGGFVYRRTESMAGTVKNQRIGQARGAACLLKLSSHGCEMTVACSLRRKQPSLRFSRTAKHQQLRHAFADEYVTTGSPGFTTRIKDHPPSPVDVLNADPKDFLRTEPRILHDDEDVFQRLFSHD